jgi:hypothetical protein
MAKVILSADEVQEGDEPIIPTPGDGRGYESPLKEPDPSSLKPVGGEPPVGTPYLPRPEMELEGLPRPLVDELEETAGLPTKQKVWKAVTEFNPLWISYRNMSGRQSERTLSMFNDPKAGIFWGRTTQEPYITAWDDMRNNWSRFRVNQIEDARVLPRAT